MEWFEDATLKSARAISTVWWKCVDGTFVLVDKTTLPQFHAHINNQEESIILTKIMKTNNNCPCSIYWPTEPQVEVLIAKLY